MQNMCREKRITTILVTHNANIALCADKVIHMRDGKIKEIQLNPTPVDAREVDF